MQDGTRKPAHVAQRPPAAAVTQKAGRRSSVFPRPPTRPSKVELPRPAAIDDERTQVLTRNPLSYPPVERTITRAAWGDASSAGPPSLSARPPAAVVPHASPPWVAIGVTVLTLSVCAVMGLVHLSTSPFGKARTSPAAAVATDLPPSVSENVAPALPATVPEPQMQPQQAVALPSSAIAAAATPDVTLELPDTTPATTSAPPSRRAKQQPPRIAAPEPQGPQGLSVVPARPAPPGGRRSLRAAAAASAKRDAEIDSASAVANQASGVLNDRLGGN